MDRSTRRSHKGLSFLTGTAKRGVGVLGGFAAGLLSIGAAKSAISTTLGLAKTQLTLHKSFGLNTEAAGAWAAQAQARGADGKQLIMGFKALATQSRNAAAGSKSQVQAFKELGISQKEIVSHGDDLDWLLTHVADGLAAMPAGANRAAISARLFGRTWTAISPLLREGSKGMDEQLAMAKKYGAVIGGKPLETQEDLIKNQRELALAQLGWQVQFATRIAPGIVKGYNFILKTVRYVNREFGPTAKAVKEFADTHPELRHVAGALLAVGLAVKTISFASRVTGASQLLGVLGRIARTNAGQRAKQRIVDGFSGLGPSVERKTAPARTTLTNTMGRSGGRAGKRWGRAFGVAVVVGIALAAPDIADALAKVIRDNINKFPKPVRGFLQKRMGLPSDFYVATPKERSVSKNRHPVGGKASGGLVTHGNLPGFGFGGLVPPGEDTLAGLRYGEYVMQEPAVRKYGADTMRQINAGKMPVAGNATHQAALLSAAAELRAAVDNLTQNGVAAYMDRGQASRALKRERDHEEAGL
jgi:hypothetical protein